MTTGRLWLALITGFWLVMNLLLWRAEFGGGGETVSEIPVEGVFQRVLTSADRSTLTLQHRNERIGQLQCSPSILEENGQKRSVEEDTPDGMVRTATGYLMELDLNLLGEEPSSRWRILTRLELATNLVWRTMEIKVIQRPTVWQINVRAGESAIHLRTEEGRQVSEQVYTQADLVQYSAMLGPLQRLLPIGLPALNPETLTKNPSLGLKWTARNDWLRLGHQRVRAYRLRAQLFGRYELVAYFSKAGELLKVTLPDGYVLTNEAVTSLDHP